MQTIIMEGPDCAGKTTLINSEFEQFKRKHNGVYGSSDIACKAYINQLNSIQEDTVFDRMHLSELVYGSAIRGSAMDKKLFAVVELLAAYREAVLIICLPPKETLIESWKNRRGKEYVKRMDQMLAIYDVYEKAHQLTKIPTIYYDYTDVEFNTENPLLQRISELKARFYGS